MITYHPISEPGDEVFSIVIPSWNNLPYLKVCVASIRDNSKYDHQIIVHVNEGNDGTVDWLKDQKIDHSYSKDNVGVCYSVNAAASMARTDQILYMNDDMYACPHWDAALKQEIDAIGHEYYFLSGTMIEPKDTANPCAIAPFDYGSGPDDFDERGLLKMFDQPNLDDWYGATWPPNVVHRKLWEQVGGLSVEFSPGMYSDPDLSMKLWQAGVRYFKGLSASRVYHFQSRSTGRVKKNNGRAQFLQKWGITPGHFNKEVIKRGEPWNGPLPDVKVTPTPKDKIKRLFT